MKMFNTKDISGKCWMGQISKDEAYKKLKLDVKGDLIEYCIHFR